MIRALPSYVCLIYRLDFRFGKNPKDINLPLDSRFIVGYARESTLYDVLIQYSTSLKGLKSIMARGGKSCSTSFIIIGGKNPSQKNMVLDLDCICSKCLLESFLKSFFNFLLLHFYSSITLLIILPIIIGTTQKKTSRIRICK